MSVRLSVPPYLCQFRMYRPIFFRQALGQMRMVCILKQIKKSLGVGYYVKGTNVCI